MCLAVYLASSVEVPAHLRGHRDAPAFYLEPAEPNAKVRRQFAVPHVYYAGSHTGCGCGFLGHGEDDEDRVLTHANYVALGQCIRAAQAEGATIELFSCWEGGQAKNPRFSETRSVGGIEDPAFTFGEGHFIRVE